ncbi:MAG: DNA polymerase IV [Gemmatimonadales bacterium]|nr:DNA polymerase IV [Gemmatimonadales bacterium]
MDAYFASVEMLDNPALCGCPVIVGGTPEGRGVVSAASYEARKFGVHSAMSAVRARQLCPEGVFLPGRMDRYAEVSGQVFAIFKEITPLVEPLSIDEAFLDVTGCRRLFGSPAGIGRLIKRRIAQEVGLVASVGVASNKFLAKLASDLEKPNGFVTISDREAPALLADLPVQKLWGVGQVLREELNAFGILKVKDLLAVPLPLLVNQFGDRVRHLLELAEGRDDRDVIPGSQAKSIGNETTFPEDISDPDHLLGVLNHLTDKVSRRLRNQGFKTRTLTLKYRFPDFTTYTRGASFTECTDSGTLLRSTARKLFLDHPGRTGKPLRLIGVTASNLSSGSIHQPELFSDAGKERDRSIDRVLDQVHGRFGPKLNRG